MNGHEAYADLLQVTGQASPLCQCEAAKLLRQLIHRIQNEGDLKARIWVIPMIEDQLALLETVERSVVHNALTL